MVWCCRPFTLAHGDLRSDNLFQAKSKTGFKFIDWQTFAAAPPGCEMVQFLSASIHPMDGMEKFDEILTAYLDTLHAKQPAVTLRFLA